VDYIQLLGRLARAARAAGHPADYALREIAVEEAFRQASAGGYQGMLPDELDCRLCDEVGESSPLQALLGRPLMPLDAALTAALPAA
jgi:hypothetical protein